MRRNLSRTATVSQLLDAITGVANACEPIPGIVTGGQPALQHLTALKHAGCAVVIDIRETMEPQPFRTPDAVTLAGLEYRGIPVGHGAVSDATFGRMLDSVRELAGKRPTFIYCASGNRVGAGLLPYFMLDRRMDEEEAVGLALRVGLRSAELMEQAIEYAHRRLTGGDASTSASR
jgi:protein tyrosine phosphatase (PTP) superfamily phosphohydrolase (DUF442 family)